MLTASLLVGLAAVSSPSSSAHAGTLNVAIQELRCPNHERIVRDIQRAVLPAMESQPDLSLFIETPGPTLLQLRLEGPYARVERIISLRSAECPELSQTIALLVRSWLHRRWSEPPTDDPELERRDPVPAEPNDDERLRADRAGGSAAATGWQLRLLAGGGAQAFLGAGPALAAGSLGVEWHSRTKRWGAGLRLGAQAPLTARLAPGSVSVGLWRLAALAVLDLLSFSAGGSGGADDHPAGLDLVAGPALCLMPASSENYSHNLDANLLDVAAVAGLRLRWRAAGPLSVFAALEGGVSLRDQTLNVVGRGPALVIPRGAAGLTAGLLWDLE